MQHDHTAPEYRGLPLPEIVARLNAGDTLPRMAAELGVTKQALQQMLARRGYRTQWVAVVR